MIHLVMTSYVYSVENDTTEKETFIISELTKIDGLLDFFDHYQIKLQNCQIEDIII